MKQKLSVLFICGWYPSKVFPNNGDFIQRHAEAASLMNEVTVIHIISDKQNKESLFITSEEKNGVKTHIAYIKFSKNPLKKCLNYLKAFNSLINKIDNFNVVHLNEIFPFGIFSLYLKWIKKTPYIISEHWTGYHKPQSDNLSLTRKVISKIITKNASFICPVSNDLKKSLIEIGFKGNYKRVPNVVNTNLFYPKKNNTEKFTIIHISNMINEHKNVEGILNVISKLEKEIDCFEIKLIGVNSHKYLSYAKKLNLNLNNIHFIDHIPHKEIAKKIQNSNLFVLFSNYENLPCVILESFSCGVPVISTNVGGIREYFPKDFGYLIDPKDENALLNKILNVYNNFNLDKERMHSYAVKNFSETYIANQFTELYNSALKNKIEND